ncbi:hypothetical protein DPMN_134748 [Dreissena polymorpha]|uniref:Uncharacterized protein n=1 Tax=Dreissena polymorpha TaxID=45954 RepID=A0A9D4FXR4_DREPO|nr:hypothetical protein DPMN_134748 [Dreissena polymorpha]
MSAKTAPHLLYEAQEQFFRNMTATLVGSQQPLQATVQQRKLAWFGHVTKNDSLCKTVLQGTL